MREFFEFAAKIPTIKTVFMGMTSLLAIGYAAAYFIGREPRDRSPDRFIAPVENVNIKPLKNRNRIQIPFRKDMTN